jgi:hypothetical protein
MGAEVTSSLSFMKESSWGKPQINPKSFMVRLNSVCAWWENQVDESNEWLHLLLVSWSGPVYYSGNLDGIHFNLIDNAQILNPSLLKFTFHRSKIKLVLTHSVKNQSSDMSMFFDWAGKDQNIIKIHWHNSFCDEILEDFIHHVAGLLVRPKYMTRGSKRPWKNTAFHSSPSRIWIVLYPQCMLSLVKYSAPRSQWIRSSMSGRRYWFFCVMALRAQ